MLLTIDVGNTNIKYGVFDGKKLLMAADLFYVAVIKDVIVNKCEKSLLFKQ